MAPCEASRHASIFPSFLVSRRHGPDTNDPGTGGINPWRAFGSGSRGSEAGAGGLGLPCRRRCALTVTAGRAASRWRRTFRYGLGPKASVVPSGLPHSSPRTVFQITPWQGAGLSGQWRRIRTFDNQNLNLMLYQTELSVVQTAGIEPATSGPKSGALPLSYIRDPNPQSGAVYRAAKPPARAETKAPTVVLTSVLVTGSAAIEPATGCRKRHCRGEFAASFGCGISATLLAMPGFQNVTRPSTRRPSPCGSTTTASPSRGATPVSATIFSR